METGAKDVVDVKARGHAEAKCERCNGQEWNDPRVSHTNGMVSIECAECQRRKKVFPPMVLLLEDGKVHEVLWHEDEVVRKPKLEGDLDDEKFVTVTLKMPKAVRGRLRYAGAIARVLNGIDAEGAWPVSVIEAIVEDYITGNEHLVKGVTLTETDDGDFVAEIADDATTTQHERSESVRRKMTELGTDQVAKATMALAEEEGALAGDDGGEGDEPTVADLDDGPLDPEIAAAVAEDDAMATNDKQAKGWTPRVVSDDDLAASDGQPVDARTVKRAGELEAMTNETLVKMVKANGGAATPRMPKRLLVRMIVNAEFPHAAGQEG